MGINKKEQCGGGGVGVELKIFHTNDEVSHNVGRFNHKWWGN